MQGDIDKNELQIQIGRLLTRLKGDAHSVLRAITELGIKQCTIARVISVSDPVVSDWMHGHPIPAKHLHALRELLSVVVDIAIQNLSTASSQSKWLEIYFVRVRKAKNALEREHIDTKISASVIPLRGDHG